MGLNRDSLLGMYEYGTHPLEILGIPTRPVQCNWNSVDLSSFDIALDGSQSGKV